MFACRMSNREGVGNDEMWEVVWLGLTSGEVGLRCKAVLGQGLHLDVIVLPSIRNPLKHSQFEAREA